MKDVALDVEVFFIIHPTSLFTIGCTGSTVLFSIFLYFKLHSNSLLRNAIRSIEFALPCPGVYNKSCISST